MAPTIVNFPEVEKAQLERLSHIKELMRTCNKTPLPNKQFLRELWDQVKISETEFLLAEQKLASVPASFATYKENEVNKRFTEELNKIKIYMEAAQARLNATPLSGDTSNLFSSTLRDNIKVETTRRSSWPSGGVCEEAVGGNDNDVTMGFNETIRPALINLVTPTAPPSTGTIKKIPGVDFRIPPPRRNATDERPERSRSPSPKQWLRNPANVLKENLHGNSKQTRTHHFDSVQSGDEELRNRDARSALTDFSLETRKNFQENIGIKSIFNNLNLKTNSRGRVPVRAGLSRNNESGDWSRRSRDPSPVRGRDYDRSSHRDLPMQSGWERQRVDPRRQESHRDDSRSRRSDRDESRLRRLEREDDREDDQRRRQRDDSRSRRDERNDDREDDWRRRQRDDSHPRRDGRDDEREDDWRRRQRDDSRPRQYDRRDERDDEWRRRHRDDSPRRDDDRRGTYDPIRGLMTAMGKVVKAKAPPFSGNVEHFELWKLRYEETVHNNQYITDAEKFSELLAAIPPDLPCIHSFRDQPNAYQKAWENLKQFYYNLKHKLDKKYDVLMTMTPVENSSKGLMTLYELTIGAFAAVQRGFQEHFDNLGIHSTPHDINTATMNGFVVRMLDRRLPPTVRETIFQKFDNPTAPIDLPVLLNEIQNQARMMHARYGYTTKVAAVAEKDANPSGGKKHHVNAAQGKSNEKSSDRTPNVVKARNKPRVCMLCKVSEQQAMDHSIWDCQLLGGKTAAEKNKLLRSKKLCCNCGLHLFDKEKPCQKDSQCKRCKLKHHDCLHFDEPPKRHHANVMSSAKEYVVVTPAILPTVKVNVVNELGVTGVAVALLDTGATRAVVSREFAKRMMLPMITEHNEVDTVGGRVISKHVTEFLIRSRKTKFEMKVSAFVMPTTTGVISGTKLPSRVKRSRLANDEIGKDLIPDMIFGSAEFEHIFIGDRKKITENMSVYKTELGDVVIGTAVLEPAESHHVNHLKGKPRISFENLFGREPQLGFDEMPNDSESDHVYVVNYFNETTTRKKTTGQYVTRIPFKAQAELGESFNAAMCKLKATHRKFERNPEAKKFFVGQINDMIDRGVLRAVKKEDIKCFVSSHLVTKETSLTTKHRLVSNFSEKTSNMVSVNDAQYTGPALQQPIPDVIAKSRIKKHFVSSDLRKFYQCILMHEADQMYQGMVWAENAGDPVQFLVYTTVAFGQRSAPAVALLVLNKMADDNPDLPLAAAVLREKMYIDDATFACDTIEEAKETIRQLIEIARRSGMHFTKWTSNTAEVLAEVPEEDRLVTLAQALAIDEKTDEVKTLGSYYNMADDTYTYKVRKMKVDGTTMRELCSSTHSIFDSICLINPVIQRLKFLMQEVFRSGIGWDDPVDAKVLEAWRLVAAELPLLETLKIARHVPFNEKSELHVFSDASTKMYGACAYIRTPTAQGIEVNLLLAQGNMIAIKPPTTVPRSELCAAVVAVKLVERVRKICGRQIPAKLWIDSQPVIAQIQRPPEMNAVYVANRTRIIRAVIPVEDIFYINTKDNFSADLISRSCSPAEFLEPETQRRWFFGPEFLQDQKIDYHHESYNTDLEVRRENLKHQVNALIVETESVWDEVIERAKSYTGLVLTIAIVIRAKQRWKRSTWGFIKPSEFREAEKIVLKRAQEQAFATEIRKLEAGRPVKRGPLTGMRLQLKEGVLYASTRLQRMTNAPERMKCPPLMPKLGKIDDAEPITKLLLQQVHEEVMHGGEQYMLARLRESHWVLHPRKSCQSIIANCVPCARYAKTDTSQLMANLPDQRVNDYKPFEWIALDNCCILDLVTGLRGSKVTKGYLLIVKCCFSRGIIIEVVENMTAEAHIDALNRVFAGVGLPIGIISDNGKNFCKANKMMAADRETAYKEIEKELGIFCQNQRIELRYNPVYASHTGGIFEIEVKIVKKHLNHVTRNLKITPQHALTLAKRVQACVNSRPLGPITNDLDDFQTLTPSMIMIGRNIKVVPEPIKSWKPGMSYQQRALAVAQQAQCRWIKDIQSLPQTRLKMQNEREAPRINQLVLIKQSNVKPSIWPMARITKHLPDKEGIVRMVQVIRAVNNEGYPHASRKYPVENRTEVRHVSQLCALPVDVEPSPSYLEFLPPQGNQPVVQAQKTIDNQTVTKESSDTEEMETRSTNESLSEDSLVKNDNEVITIENEVEKESIAQKTNASVLVSEEPMKSTMTAASDEAPPLRRSTRSRKAPSFLVMTMLIALAMNTTTATPVLEGRTWSMLLGMDLEANFTCNRSTAIAMIEKNPFHLWLSTPDFQREGQKRNPQQPIPGCCNPNNTDLPDHLTDWDRCVLVARLEFLRGAAPNLVRQCIEKSAGSPYHMCATGGTFLNTARREYIGDNWQRLTFPRDFPGNLFLLIAWTFRVLVENFWWVMALIVLAVMGYESYRTYKEAAKLPPARRSLGYEKLLSSWIEFALFWGCVSACVTAVTMSPSIPIPNASQVTPVAPGVLAMHRAQAVVSAGHLVVHVDTNIDVGKDMETLHNISRNYHRICTRLSESDLPESNCYERLSLVRQHTNKTACFIAALFPTWNATRTRRSIGESIAVQILNSFAGHSMASAGSRVRTNVPKIWPWNYVDEVPTEESRKLKREHEQQAQLEATPPQFAKCDPQDDDRSPRPTPLKTTEPQDVPKSRQRRSNVMNTLWRLLFSGLDQLKQLNITQIAVPEPQEVKPKSRKRRAGVITMLWRFLFGSDDSESADTKKLALAQFSTTMTMAALSHDVQRLADQERLAVDSNQRVINGIVEMEQGVQKFNINTLNLMMAEEHNHAMIICLMLERKYELLSSKEHWATTYEAVHDEIQSQLPAGTKTLDVSDERMMEMATFENIIKDSKIVTTIQIPLVYALNFEVLELFAVPNLNARHIIEIPKRLMLVNELQGSYAFLEQDDIEERITPVVWLVRRLPLKTNPSTITDCVAAAVLRKIDGENCETKQLAEVYNQWTEIATNKWLFYSSYKEVGWYRCTKSRDRIVESSGILNIKAGCSVEASDTIILETVSDVETRNLFLIPEEEMIDIVKTEEVKLKINVTQPTKAFDFNVTDPILVPLIDPETMFQKTGFWTSFGHHILSITLVVALVSAGIWIICLYGKRRNLFYKRAIENANAEFRCATNDVELVTTRTAAALPRQQAQLFERGHHRQLEEGASRRQPRRTTVDRASTHDYDQLSQIDVAHELSQIELEHEIKTQNPFKTLERGQESKHRRQKSHDDRLS